MADTRTDTGEGLPDLPEPGINTASHIHTRIVGYTAEQVRQAQREAVEAASMSFDDITGDEPDWWHRLQAAAEAMDDAGLTANAVDARFIAGHLLAALRAQQPAPLQQPLTNERIDELCKPWVGLGGVENQYAFARAIEAELASRGAAQGRNTSKDSAESAGAGCLSKTAATRMGSGFDGGAAQSLDMGNSQQSIGDDATFKKLRPVMGIVQERKLVSYIDAWAAHGR